jgi:hypothetical protein
MRYELQLGSHGTANVGCQQPGDHQVHRYVRACWEPPCFLLSQELQPFIEARQQ